MYHGQVVIEGNLTQDPELGTVPSGRSVCRFPIATNRYYRNSERELVSEVSYVTIDTWGSLADSCGKYLRKGRGVRVVGRLKQDRWKDEDEKTRERHVVVAEHVEFQSDPNRDKDANVEDLASNTTDIEDDAMVFEQPEKPKKKKK